MANIPSHIQVSCCRATIMDGDFIQRDGSNFATSFRQPVRGSISHLRISECHPTHRHPWPVAADLPQIPFLLSFPRGGDAAAATIIPAAADKPSSAQSLLNPSHSWWWWAHLPPLNTWDWEKALSEPVFTALKRMRHPATILTIWQRLATGLRIRHVRI